MSTSLIHSSSEFKPLRDACAAVVDCVDRFRETAARGAPVDCAALEAEVGTRVPSETRCE